MIIYLYWNMEAIFYDDGMELSEGMANCVAAKKLNTVTNLIRQ